MIRVQQLMRSVLTYVKKSFRAALLLSAFLSGVFLVETVSAENFYPYITTTLPIPGGYVGNLVISKQNTNLLFALVWPNYYGGKPKPSDKPGLYTLDISAPTEIKQISYLPVVSPMGMELSPNGQTLFVYAYSPRHNPEGWYGVLALDISNAHSMKQIWRLDIDMHKARVSVDSTLLFVHEREQGANSPPSLLLKIYKLSSNNKPTLLACIREKRLIRNFFPTPDGRHLILDAMGDFIIYDITNPSAPRVELEMSPNFGFPKQIGNDRTMYLIDGDELILATIFPKATRIGDFRGRFSDAEVEYISDENKTVYLVTIDKTIHVLDIGNKRDPKLVAQYSTPNSIGSVIPGRNKSLIYAGLDGSIVIIDPAKSIATPESLISAHAESLRQYKRKDLKFDFERVGNAINVLEAAGIRTALKKKPTGISDKIFANILNDYGFFLGKRSRENEAIEAYMRASKLDPTRAVAYLNLGDALRKQLSRADSFREKITLTKEIKAAYIQYKELHGKSTPDIDSFLALNIVDNPIADFCEYVAEYTNQGRLRELFGSGRSVEKSNGQGTMRGEISYGGTAHFPYVRFVDNETNKEIDEPIPDNGRDAPWADDIGIVPFSDGHHLLYCNNDRYLVISAPISAARKTGRSCQFTVRVTELFNKKGTDLKLCRTVQSSKHPPFITFNKSNYLNREVLKAAGYTPHWMHESGVGEVDFDNDGTAETLVQLNYASGAGPGCDYNFFDLLNKGKDGFSTSKSRSLLLKMQGIEHDASGIHPVPYCRGNITGWFIYNDITYFETRYPKDQPENSQQEFHTVSFIKEGQIKRVCEAQFKHRVEIKRGK